MRSGRGLLAFPLLGVTLDVSFDDERPKAFPEDRYTAFFDAGRIAGLTMRTFREGDRFMPLGMEQSVKVKDYFIARKVPGGKRRRIPLLLSGDDIIWVVGMRISEPLQSDRGDNAGNESNGAGDERRVTSLPLILLSFRAFFKK